MPSTLKRYQEAGNFHFITFSCHGRKPLLLSPSSRDIVEDELEKVRKRFDWCIAGYVVMPEHVHLLVNEPALSPLSLAIQQLKKQVSVRLKPTELLRFWLPRYYDFNVITWPKYVEKLRYIHRNPVTRELVPAPEDYSWSSFCYYGNRTQGKVKIEPEHQSHKLSGAPS